MNKLTKSLIPIGAAIVIYVIGICAINFSASPTTADGAPQLTSQAWLFLSIFVGVIVGLILEPVPPAMIGLIGVAVAVFFHVGAPYAATLKDGTAVNFNTITNAQSISWGLSGFADSTVFLIFCAFALGLGYQQSGLGKRIALLLVSKLGKSTLGLGYAVALTDGVLAPFIPSNTARSGGVVYPIISAIPGMFDSSATKDRRKIGSYIMWVALASTCVTSSMFLTGLAPNVLGNGLIAGVKGIGQPFSWIGWFVAMLPAGIILFVLTPLVAYKIYPPEIKGSPQIVTWAKGELNGLGRISSREKWMIGISVFALVFWILSSITGLSKIWPLYLNATTTAVIAIIFMLIFKIFTWDDFLGNKPAWNVLVWFGTLVALATGLSNVGFLKWLTSVIQSHLGGLPWFGVLLVLLLAFWFLHYFFASTTAHTTALLVLFATAALALLPSDKVFAAVLLLMLEVGIMGIITPYGTGPSPVYFGSGYISSSEFWKNGTIFGFMYLIIFLVVEIPWVLFVVKGLITP